MQEMHHPPTNIHVKLTATLLILKISHVIAVTQCILRLSQTHTRSHTLVLRSNLNHIPPTNMVKWSVGRHLQHLCYQMSASRTNLMHVKKFVIALGSYVR